MLTALSRSSLLFVDSGAGMELWVAVWTKTVQAFDVGKYMK